MRPSSAQAKYNPHCIHLPRIGQPKRMARIVTRPISHVQLRIPNPIDPSGLAPARRITDSGDLIPLASPTSSFKIDHGLFSTRFVANGEIPDRLEIFGASDQIAHIGLRLGPAYPTGMSESSSRLSERSTTYHEYLSFPFKMIC